MKTAAERTETSVLAPSDAITSDGEGGRGGLMMALVVWAAQAPGICGERASAGHVWDRCNADKLRLAVCSQL